MELDSVDLVEVSNVTTFWPFKLVELVKSVFSRSLRLEQFSDCRIQLKDASGENLLSVLLEEIDIITLLIARIEKVIISTNWS